MKHTLLVMACFCVCCGGTRQAPVLWGFPAPREPKPELKKYEPEVRADRIITRFKAPNGDLWVFWIEPITGGRWGARKTEWRGDDAQDFWIGNRGGYDRQQQAENACHEWLETWNKYRDR